MSPRLKLQPIPAEQIAALKNLEGVGFRSGAAQIQCDAFPAIVSGMHGVHTWLNSAIRNSEKTSEVA